MTIATAALPVMKTNCDETIYKLRNRTLKRFKCFARKHQKGDSLRQFWNVLTGIPWRCQFEDQTDSLIMDVFTQI